MSTDLSSPKFTRRIPSGDDRDRLVCDSCGWINYENPKIVTGAVVEHDGKILLCRRAIDPRHGFWTIPAGFLEEHETVEDGAKREAYEEARAKITMTGLLAVYSIPRISQIQIIYRAKLIEPSFAPGPESLDVALFAWDDIPWDQLAFPSVHWALHHYDAVRGQTVFPPFANPDGDLGDRLPSGL